MGGSSSPPRETASEAAMRSRQILDLTSLDAQANVIRKRSLRGRSGARAFRTSALDRMGGGLFSPNIPAPSAGGSGVGESVNSPGTSGSSGGTFPGGRVALPGGRPPPSFRGRLIPPGG